MVPSSSAHWAVGSTTSGEFGGLGQEDVGHDQEIQRPQPVDHPVHVGRGYGDVRGQDEQRPHAPGGAHPVEHLEGGEPGLRQRRVDAPDRGHVRSSVRVGQLAVAGQLVGLLAVFPAALSVALPGDGAVAGRRLAGSPSARARLMYAWAVSVPELCCSAPRAVKIIALGAVASAFTTARRSDSGTPVIRSTGPASRSRPTP